MGKSNKYPTSYQLEHVYITYSGIGPAYSEIDSAHLFTPFPPVCPFIPYGTSVADVELYTSPLLCTKLLMHGS